MQWYFENDNTSPVITAKSHVVSAHVNSTISKLPVTCVIFEIGMALRYIEEMFNTTVLIEKLPCFLENPKCLMIDSYDKICFTRGGYGSPVKSMLSLFCWQATNIHYRKIRRSGGGETEILTE